MSLKLHSFVSKGEKGKELIWLEVLADIANLSYYAVCDTTFNDDHTISNELRHIYWFPGKEAKKGDFIKLVTGLGANSAEKNDRGTVTHTFHWNLGVTVWNKDGDCAVLLQLSSWSTLKG